MSPVTSETRIEWSSRLAKALVQGGYDTEANLAPLVAEAQATGRPWPICSSAGIWPSRASWWGHWPIWPSFRPSTWLRCRRARTRWRPCRTTWLGSTAQWPSSSTETCWPWRSPSRRPPQDLDALASRVGHRINPGAGRPSGDRAQIAASASAPSVAPGPAPDSPLVDSGRRSDELGDARSAERRDSCSKRAFPAAATDGSMPLHIDDLLRYAVAVGASDLHLTAACRVDPSARSDPTNRRVSAARQRDDPGHGLRHPAGLPA